VRIRSNINYSNMLEDSQKSGGNEEMTDRKWLSAELKDLFYDIDTVENLLHGITVLVSHVLEQDKDGSCRLLDFQRALLLGFLERDEGFLADLMPLVERFSQEIEDLKEKRDLES